MARQKFLTLEAANLCRAQRGDEKTCEQVGFEPCTDTGKTPFMWSARQGDLPRLRFLVESTKVRAGEYMDPRKFYHADNNSAAGIGAVEHGFIALNHALWSAVYVPRDLAAPPNFEAAQYLLSVAPPLSAVPEDMRLDARRQLTYGLYILCHSSDLEAVELARELLALGASARGVRVTSRLWLSPTRTAIPCAHLDMVKLLLNVDPALQDDAASVASVDAGLAVLARCGGSFEKLRWIVQESPSCALYGRTEAVQIAMLEGCICRDKGDLERLAFVLRHFSCATEVLDKALLPCVLHEQHECLRMLLEAGASSLSSHSWHALMRAVQIPKLECAEALLEFGVSVQPFWTETDQDQLAVHNVMEATASSISTSSWGLPLLQLLAKHDALRSCVFKDILLPSAATYAAFGSDACFAFLLDYYHSRASVTPQLMVRCNERMLLIPSCLQNGGSKRAAECLRALLGCFEELPREALSEMFDECLFRGGLPMPELLCVIAPHVSQEHRSAALKLCVRSPENLAAVIAFGVNVNWATAHGYTALQTACSQNQRSCESVKVLLAAGADPNACHAPSQHPLLLALWDGQEAKAQELLAAGARVPPGTQALGRLFSEAWESSRACSDLRVRACARLLVAGGADVNETWGARSVTPLMLAVRKGLFGCAQTLLENGADARAKDADGDTVRVYLPRRSACSAEFMALLERSLERS